MEQFLKKHNLPQLTQYEVQNNLIIFKEIELIMETIPKWKSPVPDVLLVNCNSFKEEIKHQFQTIASKSRRGGNTSNSFYEACITLMSNPERDSTRKENYRAIYLMRINTKNLIKYQQTEFSNM